MYANRVISDLANGGGSLRSNEYADAYRSLFERSGICMASLNADLRVQEANETFTAELGGGASGAPEGRELFDFLRVQVQSDLRRQLMRLATGWSERVVERVQVVRGGEQPNPAQLTAVSTKAETREVPRVVVMLQWDEVNEGPARPGGRLQLTELDARILKGVAMGMSTVNLAAKLYLSRQGVEYHVGTMLKKFKASNRPALVSRAYSLGVLDAASWPPKVAPEFIK